MDNPETFMGNIEQEWTIQRYWQHWVHKAWDEGYRKLEGQSGMDNPEILTT
jgi:hypothetical protein